MHLPTTSQLIRNNSYEVFILAMHKSLRQIVIISVIYLLIENVNAQIDDFECQQQGRYTDINDEKCRNYFLCTKTFDNILQVSKQQCPLGTLFNKNIMRCVLETNYVCKKITRLTIEDQTTLQSTDELNETTDSSELMSTSEITLQNSWKPQTHFNLHAATLSEMITNNPEFPRAGQFSKVTEEQTIFKTDLPEIIDTSESLSSDMISVFAIMQLNSTVKMQTTSSTKLIPLLTAYSQSNKCTIPGNFPDMTSKDCERFISCSKLPNGKLHNSILSCPTSTAFSFDSQRCLLRINYQCPLTQPLSKSTIETPTTPNGIFNCFVQGSFLNQFDLDCNTFHLCYRNENGHLLYTEMQCPKSLIFSPLHYKCVSSSTNICQNRLSVIPLN